MSLTTSPVVVGVDGSDDSIQAARWAAAVADEYETSLLLVHSAATTGRFISDAAVIAIRAASAADQIAAADKALSMTKERLADEFAGLAIDARVVEAPVDEALVELSRDAAFVVLGCDQLSPLAAVLVGSTSLRVATRARCPVVAWRRQEKPDAAPVVVGVDGTPAGTAALAAAFEFADQFGTPVTAVRAWSTVPAGEVTGLPYPVDWDALRTGELTVLADAVQPWRERYPNVHVDTLLDDARPAQALLDRLNGAQLVVVGNHRANVVTAALLGSTTLNLLHHSVVPVMVCHAEVAA